MNIRIINFLVYGYCFIILAIGCNKSDITFDDIRQTDENGTIISTGNPNEWQTGANMDDVNNAFDKQDGYDYISFLYDEENLVFQLCNEEDGISALAYPNPVEKNEKFYLQFLSEDEISLILISTKAQRIAMSINDGGISRSGDNYQVELNAFDLANQSNTVYYTLYLTEEECTHVGYGTIMVQ